MNGLGTSIQAITIHETQFMNPCSASCCCSGDQDSHCLCLHRVSSLAQETGNRPWKVHTCRWTSVKVDVTEEGSAVVVSVQSDSRESAPGEVMFRLKPEQRNKSVSATLVSLWDLWCQM